MTSLGCTNLAAVEFGRSLITQIGLFTLTARDGGERCNWKSPTLRTGFGVTAEFGRSPTQRGLLTLTACDGRNDWTSVFGDPAAYGRSQIELSTLLDRAKGERRDWKSPTLRTVFEDTGIYPINLGYPLFIHKGADNIPIQTMTGCNFLGFEHGLVEEVAKARDLGINTICLLPRAPGPDIDAIMTPAGGDEDHMLVRAICLLKEKFPDLVIFSEVALQKEVMRKNGDRMHQLCKQAVALAGAGADVVTPSDIMLNGWIRAIREALDDQGFQHVPIMSDCANGKGDYCAPQREIILESCKVKTEGAGIFLVKPAFVNSDIIQLLRRATLSPMPVVAYQTPNEYAKIKKDIIEGVVHEGRILGYLMGMRGNGASIIFTFFALQAARTLWGK